LITEKAVFAAGVGEAGVMARSCCLNPWCLSSGLIAKEVGRDTVLSCGLIADEVVSVTRGVRVAGLVAAVVRTEEFRHRRSADKVSYLGVERLRRRLRQRGRCCMIAICRKLRGSAIGVITADVFVVVGFPVLPVVETGSLAEDKTSSADRYPLITSCTASFCSTLRAAVST
jgi:hypothetical protein